MKAVDLFAGCGGFSQAAHSLGIDVIWAANHWPMAVEYHAQNHPTTQHVCQDLRQADWSQVPAHELLLASPCCQGHSRARGKDKPHHDASRSTAWAVVDCAEYHEPENVIVENVPEFMEWKLYPRWKQCLQDLGYHVSTQVVDAADAGVPQNRLRLFVVATRRPFAFQPPAETHQPVWIQWDAGRWSKIEKPGRSLKTLQRVANGRAAFGDRFVMPYYGSGSGLTGRCLSRPLGTVTTRDRWAAVDGDRMRMLTVEEYSHAMSFPASYRLPGKRKDAIHMLGNAVPPKLAAWVIQQVAA